LVNPPASEAVALTNERTFWRQLIGQALSRSLLPLALTAGFLAALLLNPAFDRQRLATALREAAYGWLVPAVAVFFLGVWLRTLRWQILLSPLARVPVRRLLPVLVLGLAANNLLPARVGELVRAQALWRREGVSRAACLATILVERVFDGLTLLALLAVAALLLPLGEWVNYLVPATTVLFLLVLGGVLLLAWAGQRVLTLVARLVAWLPTRLGQRVVALAHHFLTGLQAVQAPRGLLLVALVSLANWLVEAAVYLLVLRAFTSEAPAWAALAVTATANLALLIPASQGGIGPFEFFAAQTLLAVGVPAATATAYAFVVHATVLVPVIPPGLWVAWRGWRSR
jgi:uncharacterized protein (TIRG00374 family)